MFTLFLGVTVCPQWKCLQAAAAMTYGIGVAQNNADLGGGGGMNDEEYDENSSARLFERSRIKALAGLFFCSFFSELVFLLLF
ncbi:hypothetical protein Q1695_003182 [Nippostrongylus brasiliensis]|nr:hypothetical protein Q1695_003182 [Nippostrongylus brasiliensis]